MAHPSTRPRPGSRRRLVRGLLVWWVSSSYYLAEGRATPGGCIAGFEQCDGIDFRTKLACCEGYQCVAKDAFYSGCVLINSTNYLTYEEPLPQQRQTMIDTKRQAPNEPFNYAQVLYLSILFYEAQRSGQLSKTKLRIPWRGDSAMRDRGLHGEDLTGGWYDSGGHIKFTLPLDYLTKAHVSPMELYVQVGDQNDNAYWGAPESIYQPRNAYKIDCDNPGTEPAAETVAAFAAGYLVFKDIDPYYANALLGHATQLYQLADQCRGVYAAAGPLYFSYSGYMDELAWASLWLHRATGNATYLDKARALYDECCSYSVNRAFTWDDQGPGVQILMYKHTGDPKYAEDVSDFVSSWMSRLKTPQGLSYYTWAPSKFTSSTAFIALLAADLGINPKPFRRYARSQIHYLLGEWSGSTKLPDGQVVPNYSYVIGYGDNFPRAPHHRGSSCASKLSNRTCRCSSEPNAYILYGALVGGPDASDSYDDNCPDFTHNDVSLVANAGFQSAVAGLKHLYMAGLAF